MNNTRKQAGYSFIEVLVAMLVLGISVLAFAGLQVRALDTTNVSNVRSQAVTLASELTERIRANSSAVAITEYKRVSNYDGAASPPGVPATWSTSCMKTSATAAGCTPANMAKYDISEVEYLAGQLLPAGRVLPASCVASAAVLCIYVSWAGTNPATCTSNASPNCIAMQVVVQ